MRLGIYFAANCDMKYLEQMVFILRAGLFSFINYWVYQIVTMS